MTTLFEESTNIASTTAVAHPSASTTASSSTAVAHPSTPATASPSNAAGPSTSTRASASSSAGPIRHGRQFSYLSRMNAEVGRSRNSETRRMRDLLINRPYLFINIRRVHGERYGDALIATIQSPMENDIIFQAFLPSRYLRRLSTEEEIGEFLANIAGFTIARFNGASPEMSLFEEYQVDEIPTPPSSPPPPPPSTVDCPICLDGPRDTVFNCGHTCCSRCAARLARCHFCRTRITNKIRIY